MSITSVIKKYAVEQFKSYGFIFEGKQGSARWIFSRKSNGIKQFLAFQKSNYAQQIRLEFFTSKNIVRYYSISELLLNNDYWHNYENEEELKEVILVLVQQAIKYAIPCLEIISMPDLNPTSEMIKDLRENTYEKYISFLQTYHLNDLNIFDALRRIEDIIKESKSESFDENKSLLINAAAYIGELIKIHHGGNWLYNDKLCKYILCNIGGAECKANPLNWTVIYWNKPYDMLYGIVYKYEKLLTELHCKNKV